MPGLDGCLKLKSCLALFVILFGMILSDQPAAATPQQLAESRVAEMLLQLDRLSGERDTAKAGWVEEFDRISSEFFDVTAMARSALGTTATTLTRGQWTSFLDAYKTHALLSFAQTVRNRGRTSSRVLDVRTTSDGTVAVLTRTISDSRQYDAVWLICPAPSGRICDVEVEGRLLSMHDRQRFADRIRVSGLEALIEALEAGWMIEAGG